ncbi:AAA family ATPase [Pararhodobacter aggregans]
MWADLGGSDHFDRSVGAVLDPTPAPAINDARLVELICGSASNADHYHGVNVADWSASYFALICAASRFSSDEAQVRRVVMDSPLVQNSPPAANGEPRAHKAARLWSTEYPLAAGRGARERQENQQAAEHGRQMAAGLSGQLARALGSVKTQPANSSRPRVRTARDLQHQHFAPVTWAVPGIVPEGLTILASVPKLGKSWLTLDIARAKADGDEVLGQRCEPGDVLLLALEDNDRRLQDRLRRVTGGMTWPLNLEYATEWPRLDQGGLDEIRNWIESKPNPALIVIDTLAMVKPIPTRGNKSAYDFDVQALKPLQQLASDKRVAIIVVTHTRKAAAEDPVEKVNATLGLTGVADTIMLLTRGPKENGAIMYARGRDIAEFEKAISFENFRWVIGGTPKEVFAGETQKLLIDAIRNGAITPKGMEAATGLSGENVRQTLQRMLKNQTVFKSGYGQYELASWMTGKSTYRDASEATHSQFHPHLLPP